jgi:hypothetical protein
MKSEKLNNTPSLENRNSIREKPYHTPMLKVYGDIRSLTKSVDMKGRLDGMVGSMSKTL